MKGLELGRAYFASCRPVLLEKIPDILAMATIGLAGEGSECFGMDDELSRDHDFGPGFCLWLPREELRQNRERIASAFTLLPRQFEGMPSRFVTYGGFCRVGPLAVEDFFKFFTGLEQPPSSLAQWLSLEEYQLAAAANGLIFENNCGLFQEWRETLQAHYPRDIFLKKLAARCMQMAQAGQYNLPRCLRRGDATAAFLALSRFTEATIALVFLLNRQYMPFYKWAAAMGRTLPVLGGELGELLDNLKVFAPAALDGQAACDSIESFCQVCAGLLSEYSGTATAWLWEHGPAIASRIEDRDIRSMNILRERS